MATNDNLQAAFAGESQANRMYLAFAKQAEDEGYPGIAKLFRATAEAETIHAHTHLRNMGKLKGTAENLQTAIAGEAHEYKEMYPQFLVEAESEGDSKATIGFRFAGAVEEIHHGLYTRTLEGLKVGKDLDAVYIHLCPICGNTMLGDAPDRCSVCGVPKDKFFTVR